MEPESAARESTHSVERNGEENVPGSLMQGNATYHEQTLPNTVSASHAANTLANDTSDDSADSSSTDPHFRNLSVNTTPPEPRYRVKLYQLQNNIWEDKGTGHIILFRKVKVDWPTPRLVDYTSYTLGTHFRVKCEETHNILLELPILPQEETYELQGDSLIVWTDEESNRDLALSFQESEGCKEIWNSIRRFQGAEEDAEQLILQNKIDEEQAEIHSIPLPEVSRENLRTINETLQSGYKDSIAKSILESNYLQQLFKLFDACEAEAEYDNLYLFFEIFKNMILLNDQELFQELFSERNVMRLMGALEYDPDITSRKQIAAAQRAVSLQNSAGGAQQHPPVTPPRKSNHRHYLNNVVVFKKIVPFSPAFDAEVTQKIHRAFRIQYLKESILPRCLDDATFNTLNLIICTYHQEITEAIYQDPEFLPTLFSRLKDRSISSDDRLDLIKLLLEYNSLLKNSTLFSKRRAYRKLIEFGLFDVLTHTLVDENRFTRQHSSELISTMINFDLSLVRDYMLNTYIETKKCAFFESFIKGIIEDTELGVQENLAESLRLLTDPDVHDADKSQHFLRMFYQTEFILMFLEPLRAKEEILREKMNSSRTKESSKQAIAHVLELLSDFVRLHKVPCRAALLRHNILRKVGEILNIRYQEKDLVLCIIRFLRSCMAQCDEDLNAYIIEHDLFAPILRVLKDYHLDNNMLSSAVIEMIEFLHKESDRTNSLILYIGERYESQLERMQEGIPSIRTFLDEYNKMQKALKKSMTVLHGEAGSVGELGRGAREESTSSTLDLGTEEYSSSSSSHHSLLSGGISLPGDDGSRESESDADEANAAAGSTPEKKESLRRRSSSGTESAKETDRSPQSAPSSASPQQQPEIKITPQSTQPLTSFTSVLHSSVDLSVGYEDEKYFSSASDRADVAMTHEDAVEDTLKHTSPKKRPREERSASEEHASPNKKRKIS